MTRLMRYRSKKERLAQIDQLRTVQTQRFYCRSARRGTPNDAHQVVTPGKVSDPTLAARVEKRYGTSCLRIRSADFIVLVTVASRARPGEFRQSVTRAAYTRQDVVTDKRSTTVTGRVPAVFTTVASTSANLLAHSSGDASALHPRCTPSRLFP